DDDALIACLPTCTDATHPPLYEPVTSGAHYQMKSNRSWIGKKDLPAGQVASAESSAPAASVSTSA
ncbi:MAG: hypothetical protein JWQ11_1577, partial [Rhizobacter sp.]|nr:hypothetical protein [Rhizobacter sp.]